jgi:hypothetical protein
MSARPGMSALARLPALFLGVPEYEIPCVLEVPDTVENLILMR